MIALDAIEISTIIDYLFTCPFIDDFAAILTAYNEETPDNCGVYDDGEQRIKRDLAGNEHKRHRYALVVRDPSAMDLDRIRSTNFCQRFQSWIDEQEFLGRYPVLPDNYQAWSVSAANARLNARAQDGKTAIYEIPFEITYWRYVTNA